MCFSNTSGGNDFVLFDHLQTSSVTLVVNKTADQGSGVRGPEVPGLHSDTISLQASPEHDTERTALPGDRRLVINCQ